MFFMIYTMTNKGEIEAQVLWQLLLSSSTGVLEERGSEDYSGMLENMEAAELLALMEKVQERLKLLGVAPEAAADASPLVCSTPEELFISRNYSIRIGAPSGPDLPLRPLVKSLFILFLRHPEGILLKQRDRYRRELEDIYAAISPSTAKEEIKTRVARIVDLQDNSYSEKASVLNAKLEDLLPKGTAENYKIQGYNGHPRRIPINPLLVHWER